MQGIMDTSHEPARPGYGPERPEYGAEVPGHAGYGRWGHDGYAEQMQDEPAEGPSHQGHSGRYRDGALQEPSPTVFVKARPAGAACAVPPSCTRLRAWPRAGFCSAWASALLQEWPPRLGATQLTQDALHVQGLPFDCSEDEVREAFEGCPGLLEVRLSINKATGTSKGFGFLVRLVPARRSFGVRSAITGWQALHRARAWSQQGAPHAWLANCRALRRATATTSPSSGVLQGWASHALGRSALHIRRCPQAQAELPLPVSAALLRRSGSLSRRLGPCWRRTGMSPSAWTTACSSCSTAMSRRAARWGRRSGATGCATCARASTSSGAHICHSGPLALAHGPLDTLHGCALTWPGLVAHACAARAQQPGAGLGECAPDMG